MPIVVDLWKELGFKLVRSKAKSDIFVNDCYPTIHQIDREPVSIIAPDHVVGPWIAGGAVLKWFQGYAVSCNDIDIFCNSADQAQQVVDNIKNTARYTIKHHSANAITIEYNNTDWSKNWTLQVITKRYYANIQEVIDSFDITVCQIATAGNEWIMNNETAKDIRNRALRFSGELQPDAMKRLVKYWTYGYRPDPNTIARVQNNPRANWKFSADTEYENAF